MKMVESESRLTKRAWEWRHWVAVVLLGGAVFFAYRNSFDGPFVLDDELSVTENYSIRQIWRLSGVLRPPEDSPLGGRPVANLSFAINYALGGTQVFVYHVTNVLLHACAGLALWGLVHRTALRLRPAVRRGAGGAIPLDWEAWSVATVAGGLWLVHPLATGSVTYVSQRTEVLMALLYLLTLWSFERGSDRGSAKWLGLSVLCCGLGMACKEVMVTAPLVVILYDRTFVAGSFREAWRIRNLYYLALAATWVGLAGLMSGIARRSVGFDQGVGVATYALTQCGAVWKYLSLSFWPHPLVFDYGAVFLSGAEAVPYATLLLVLIVGVVWAFRFMPKPGFAGAVFFILLAPTSSFVPVAMQPVAENRAYLPLALVVSATVVGLWSVFGRKVLLGLVVVGVVLAWQTVRRNEVYRRPIDLWQETVLQRPQNPRAHNNLGKIYSVNGQHDRAIFQFREALLLDPGYVEATVNLGSSLLETGKVGEALALQDVVVREKPRYAPAHFVRANALARSGREPEAIRELEEALRLQPRYREAMQNLIALLDRTGNPARALALCEQALALWPDDPRVQSAKGILLGRQGTPTEALARLEAELRRNPANADAHHSAGLLLAALGRHPEAARHYAETVRLNPAHAAAHANLAGELLRDGQVEAGAAEALEALRIDPALVVAQVQLASSRLNAGRFAEALTASEAALRLEAKNSDAHHLRGVALLSSGRPAEALAEFETLMALQPDRAALHDSIGGALYHLGRYAEAVAHYEMAVKSSPGDISMRQNLAGACFQAGQTGAAVERYREVLRIKPDYLEARKNLASILARLNRMAEAEAEFAAVLRQTPNDAMATEFFRRLPAKADPNAGVKP
jgi:tetratricopeptide (TPR) repeat protein